MRPTTIAEAEWNFWMAKDVLTRLPKERHGFAVGAQRNLKAAKEQLTTIKPGTELGPGIAILDTSGHTPGHISLEVGSAGDSVVVLGDALTHPSSRFGIRIGSRPSTRIPIRRCEQESACWISWLGETVGSSATIYPGPALAGSSQRANSLPLSRQYDGQQKSTAISNC